LISASRENSVANRTAQFFLLGCVGGLAAISGWMVGDELFLRNASAAISNDARNAADIFPIANRDSKRDRDVVLARLTVLEPGPVVTASADPAGALAVTPAPKASLEDARAELTKAGQVPVAVHSAPAKPAPKAEKPSRAFLNDAQIAGIKWRLNLDENQEKYWPPVEKALRALTEQIMDYQKRLKRSRDDSFDTESAEIRQLKAAAKVFFAQLRSEQKAEVVTLANVAGLGPIVAQLTSGRDVARN
jgi:hypothetical protein